MENLEEIPALDGNVKLDDILPFNLNDISPEDLLDRLGLSNQPIDKLLILLKKGALEIKETWDTKSFQDSPVGMANFHAIGKKYSPVAFKVYDLLRIDGKEPRMTISLITSRALPSGDTPDTVLFWNHADMIFGLYKTLKMDGFYGST